MAAAALTVLSAHGCKGSEESISCVNGHIVETHWHEPEGRHDHHKTNQPCDW